MEEKNSGFEVLTEKIVQAIAVENSVQTLKVEHNATIQGRTGAHPVDIYWEFTDGEVTYKTIFQTRDWDKAVGNNELFCLLSVLRDIPGQVAGVLFTQPVYQKVTRQLARDVGITLYELQAPVEDEVWQPVVGNVDIKIDADWAKAEKARLGLGDQQFRLGGEPKELFIYNANGLCIDSVQGIFNDYIKQQRAGLNFARQTITHEFKETVFLQTNDELFPRLKLDRISFVLEFFDSTEVQGEEMLHRILLSVLSYFRQ